MCIQEPVRKRLFERFLCHVVSILHLHPKKAQLQIREATIGCETSSLYLIIVFWQTKYPQAPEGKVRLWASFAAPSIDVSLPLFLLVHLFSQLSTTRWKRVFCSGNSVCTTRCWLSEALWLFPQLLGAFAQAVKVFLYPSRLGISLGSKKNRKEIIDRIHRHCSTTSSVKHQNKIWRLLMTFLPNSYMSKFHFQWQYFSISFLISHFY